MKITVVCFGSRGDTHPPLALAERLSDAGHEVTAAVPSADLELARAAAAKVIEIPGGPRDTANAPAVQDALKAGDGALAKREATMLGLSHLRGHERSLTEALTGAELALLGRAFEEPCLTLAEKLRVRVGFALCYPNVPNSRYPPLMEGQGLSPDEYAGAYDRGAAERLPAINVKRKRLGLVPVVTHPAQLFRAQRPPYLYCMPVEVLPAPTEFGDNHVYTGFWNLSPTLRAAVGEQDLPGDLLAFLDRGPPPLLVSFGSLPVLDRRVVDLFVDVAKTLGHRILFARGWSQVDIPLSEGVFAIGGANHQKLLPRCRAVVHHGGAGTTGSAMQLGVPSLIIPVAFDQPVFAERVRDLGVGTALPYTAIDRPALLRALEDVLSPAVRETAAAFARTLAELPDGATVAARFITEHPDRFPIPVVPTEL